MRLAGELPAGLVVDVGERDVVLPAGRLELEIAFRGGDDPSLAAVAVLTAEGERLLHADGEAATGRVPPRFAAAMATVVDALQHVELEAHAVPLGSIVLEVAAGIRVMLPGNAPLTVRGATRGPADQLQLCEPLEVIFGGEGIQLSHRQFRRLSRLAGIRISAATLHPDGSVNLQGVGPAPLDRAWRGGLRSASARFSDLVRRSPRFRGIRGFLKRGHSG